MTVMFSHYVPAEMPTPMTPAPASPPVAAEQAPGSPLALPPMPQDSFTPMTPSQPAAGVGMPALKFGKKSARSIQDAMWQLKRSSIQAL